MRNKWEDKKNFNNLLTEALPVGSSKRIRKQKVESTCILQLSHVDFQQQIPSKAKQTFQSTSTFTHRTCSRFGQLADACNREVV